MALDDTTPLDGDGYSFGTKVSEICTAIRLLKTNLNAGKLDRLGNGTGGVITDPVTGEVALTGTSRVYRHMWVGASALKPQGASPGFTGVFPHLSFANNLDDEAYYSTHVPYRRAAGTDMIIELLWYYTGGNDAGTCEWNLSYNSVAEGEDPTGAGTAHAEVPTSIATDDTVGKTEFTIPSAALANHDNLGLLLWRDGSDALGKAAIVLGFHITFIMGQLGLAT